jgi:hypothetical protein
MINKKNHTWYLSLKRIKIKEGYRNSEGFVNNIHEHNKKKIISFVLLNIVEKISTGRQFCRPMPADIC